MIQIFDNFFNDQDYCRILADSTNNWTLKKNMICKNLTDAFYTEKCVSLISDKIKKPVSLYRAYSRALHINQNSRIHKDINASHTALFYVNPVYDKNWLGGTLIWTDKPNYIEFKPNRLVLFNAELDHSGVKFQNTFDYRIQCVWKINI